MNTHGINTLIQDFEINLTRIVNESGMPACVVRLVFENMLAKIKDIERDAIRSEMAEYEVAKSNEEQHNDQEDGVS